MDEELFYLTQKHREYINGVLKKQFGKVISAEVLNRVIYISDVYLCRKAVPRSTAVNDLKKFQSKLNKIKKGLSYEGYLLINHKLKKLDDDLSESIEKLHSTGRPQSYARDMFIGELADVYQTITGKLPGKPYYKGENVYSGPFFRFVSNIIKVIDGKEIHAPTLKNAINKVLDSIYKPF